MADMYKIKQANDVPADQIDFLVAAAQAETPAPVQVYKLPQINGKFTLIRVYAQNNPAGL